jgi:hypothetical protein
MSKYEVAVLIELELDDTGVNVSDDPVDQEAQFELAFQQADVIMQRAWDTDQGRHHVKKWHFSILEGAVTEIDPVAGDPAGVVD